MIERLELPLPKASSSLDSRPSADLQDIPEHSGGSHIPTRSCSLHHQRPCVEIGCDRNQIVWPCAVERVVCCTTQWTHSDLTGLHVHSTRIVQSVTLRLNIC